GHDNVATGSDALSSNTTGQFNVAIGSDTLVANTSGDDNIASGLNALDNNTTGHDNVATGVQALFQNTTGNNNVATGTNALDHNNLAEGFQALRNSTGSRNIALGTGAGQSLTTGSDNIDIANPGIAGEAGTIRIGTPAKQSAAFLAGVYGKAVGATSKAVVVNPNWRLATAPAPAAPPKSPPQRLGRLRAQNRPQGQ